MPIFLNKILNTHPFCSQFAMFYSVFVSYCLIRCFLCERTINAWPTGNKFSREYFYTLCYHIHIVRPFIKVQVWNALEKKEMNVYDHIVWSLNFCELINFMDGIVVALFDNAFGLHWNIFQANAFAWVIQLTHFVHNIVSTIEYGASHLNSH